MAVQTENINDYKTIESWEDIDCDSSLLRGIYAYGFENPSPIQKKAILPVIEGRDIIAQAQSGTGKTGCFTIGALSKINLENKKTQILILSPTRELSQQIIDVLNNLGSFMKGLTTQLLIGGTSSEESGRKLLNDVPHIVVGCPGRVYDMLCREKLSPNDISLIVLDEADDMLSSGFKEQVYNILQYMPTTTQFGLFSATIPVELNSLTDKFLRNPVKILVKSEMLTLEGINQYFINLDSDSQKFNTLQSLFSSLTVSQTIIYCNSVSRVQELYDAMTSENYAVCQIHSNMEKQERTDSFNEFKNGKYRVLISSDLTARGIDIQQVSTVINFDIPNGVDKYLHRIGRSGRWGRKGTAINFVTRRDVRNMKDIESHYRTQIQEMPENWDSL